MEEFLSIAVCEDRKDEEESLLSILDRAELPNRCTVFHSAEELLEVYQPAKFDLLLMDIYMDGMTGVEAVTKIREADKDVPVAFITTSKDFALESYRLSALSYIEKPVKKEAVEAVLRAAWAVRETAPCLTVQWEGRDKRIRLSQILYMESQNRKLVIYLADGSSVYVYEKLSDVMPQLEDAPFFQSHKSYCANLGQVEYIDQDMNCFVMTNGKNIPIRRLLMAKAKKAFQDHLFRKTRGNV